MVQGRGDKQSAESSYSQTSQVKNTFFKLYKVFEKQIPILLCLKIHLSTPDDVMQQRVVLPV